MKSRIALSVTLLGLAACLLVLSGRLYAEFGDDDAGPVVAGLAGWAVLLYGVRLWAEAWCGRPPSPQRVGDEDEGIDGFIRQFEDRQ